MPFGKPFAQGALENFTGRAVWHFIDSEQAARDLVGCQVLAAEGVQRGGVKRMTGARNKNSGGNFALVAVRHADDRTYADVRMAEQQIFNLDGVDVVPPGDDHVLLAVDDKQVSVVVQIANVSA